MAIEKSIESGKEHRKEYYRSQRFDHTCRPNGSCSYCRSNRFHKNVKRSLSGIDFTETPELKTFTVKMPRI